MNHNTAIKLKNKERELNLISEQIMSCVSGKLVMFVLGCRFLRCWLDIHLLYFCFVFNLVQTKCQHTMLVKNYSLSLNIYQCRDIASFI